MEIPEGSPCPKCGQFVPQLRKVLLGVNTCARCTPQPLRIKKITTKTGGGNSVTHIEYETAR
jgi:hypothetical protein